MNGQGILRFAQDDSDQRQRLKAPFDRSLYRSAESTAPPKSDNSKAGRHAVGRFVFEAFSLSLDQAATARAATACRNRNGVVAAMRRNTRVKWL